MKQQKFRAISVTCSRNSKNYADARNVSPIGLRTLIKLESTIKAMLSDLKRRKDWN